LVQQTRTPLPSLSFRKLGCPLPLLRQPKLSRVPSPLRRNLPPLFSSPSGGPEHLPSSTQRRLVPKAGRRQLVYFTSPISSPRTPPPFAPRLNLSQFRYKIFSFAARVDGVLGPPNLVSRPPLPALLLFRSLEKVLFCHC